MCGPREATHAMLSWAGVMPFLAATPLRASVMARLAFRFCGVVMSLSAACPLI